jgi:hypothetical protein
MQPFSDLTGTRFGKLLVIGLEAERTMHGMTRWLCQCDCGKTKIMPRCNLTKTVKSCGCAKKKHDSLLVGQRVRSKRWYNNHPDIGYEKTKKWRQTHPGYLGPSRQGKVDKVNYIKESTKCCDCHQQFPACCMDFDHVKGEKTKEVGALLASSASWETIQIEIDKCELVCANCHRIRTRNRGSAAWKFKLDHNDLPKGVMAA